MTPPFCPFPWLAAARSIWWTKGNPRIRWRGHMPRSAYAAAPIKPPDDWRTSRVFLLPMEVAHLLTATRATVYAGLASGKIPGKLAIGKAVRIRVKAFAPWLDGVKAKGSAKGAA